jgi:hypothetical protein
METLTNSFHGTLVRVRSADRTLAILGKHARELTPAEQAHARRVRDALCGSDDCTCGIVRESE